MSAQYSVMYAEIQGKITALIADLSAGKISNEQFNTVYSRYHNQLSLLEQALENPEDESEESLMRTSDILQGMQARVVGLSLYHHNSGTTLETLGRFAVSAEVISPIVNDFSLRMEAQDLIDPVLKLVDGSVWVAFLAGHQTTLIVVFSNEPSRWQMRQMERLLHDFEAANTRHLASYHVDLTRLTRPFVNIVKERSSSRAYDFMTSAAIGLGH